jgi:hypothetical protein
VEVFVFSGFSWAGGAAMFTLDFPQNGPERSGSRIGHGFDIGAMAAGCKAAAQRQAGTSSVTARFNAGDCFGVANPG